MVTAARRKEERSRTKGKGTPLFFARGFDTRNSPILGEVRGHRASDCRKLQSCSLFAALHFAVMSGSADEFCVVEPLTLVDGGLVQHSGTPGGIEGIAFGEKEQAEAFRSCRAHAHVSTLERRV